MKRKATIDLPSSTVDGDGARSIHKKSSVKKKTASTKKAKGVSMITRSKGKKTKNKRKKKEAVVTPPTSNKSSKQTQSKDLPNETSILVVTEEKTKDRETSEEGKKKVVSYMTKISNEILESAKDAHEAILRAKDSEVTLALAKDLIDEEEEDKNVNEKQGEKKKVNEVNDNEEEADIFLAEDEPVCANDKNIEDKEVLKAHPELEKLLMSVEDMLVDYRNSDKKTMETDNIAFQKAAAEMVDKTFGNKKTSYMYQRYQQMWVKFSLKKKIPKNATKDLLDQHLTEFFVAQGRSYSPSTLYVMFSCVNHYFITNFGFKLNSMLRLQRFLKVNTSTYVCKKSKVFTSEQIDTVLKVCAESTDKKHQLAGVGIALMYYGLLRVCDSTKIQKKDVSHQYNGRVVIKFEHARKRRNPGFTYHVPSLYAKLFQRYEADLPVHMTPEEKYLRLWVKQDGERTKEVSCYTSKLFVKIACDILGLDPTGYTTHCFRRSAATNLADAGVSFVNLKRHGQWKSDSVAESYIANSQVLRDEREVCLLPKNLRLPYKRAGLTQELDIESLRAPFSQFGAGNNNIFELLTPPDSTQASFAPKDPPQLAKKVKRVTCGERTEEDSFFSQDEPIINLLKNKKKTSSFAPKDPPQLAKKVKRVTCGERTEEDSFFSQDEPIINLLKNKKKTSNLDRKEKNKEAKNEFKCTTPTNQKENEEVEYLKTVSPEKLQLEDEVDENKEKDLIKVERVVSTTAVPSIELVETTKSISNLEEQMIEKLGVVSKDEKKKIIFNNCTFNF